MQRNKRERKAPPTFEAGQGGGLATSSKATGSKANEGANDGSDDDSNWVPTKKVKQAAKKKVASKTASTQEEKAGLRRIRERRNEHVNLLAEQLEEEANNEDAHEHAAPSVCLHGRRVAGPAAVRLVCFMNIISPLTAAAGPSHGDPGSTSTCRRFSRGPPCSWRSPHWVSPCS